MPSTVANRTVTLDGPIFDPNVMQRFRDQIGEGIQEGGEEAEGILMGFISAAGFVKSGAFLHSVNSERQSTSGGIDASGISVTADWKHQGAGRPTKTWFEEGKRGGVRMRKGAGGFRGTAARMRSFNWESFLADKIEKALG